MKRILLTACLAIVAIITNAQTTHFLDSLRKIEDGKGKIVVMQDPEIDRIVNGTSNVTTLKKGVDEAAAPKKHAPTEIVSVKDNEIAVANTGKKVITNGYKIKGYRIQVFSGGNSREDRQKAQEAGNAMKAKFPFEPIYVHFYSPSWKCRMGNYRDLAEAQKILAQVKSLGYKKACIVKGLINAN